MLLYLNCLFGQDTVILGVLEHMENCSDNCSGFWVSLASASLLPPIVWGFLGVFSVLSTDFPKRFPPLAPLQQTWEAGGRSGALSSLPYLT